MRRSIRDECASIGQFCERYGAPLTDVQRRIERAVIGANVGANGYTTLDQANRLGRLLALKRGVRLLDIGAGRGYPGIYLARNTGCDVVVTELLPDALREGRQRAARGLAGRAGMLAATAAHLPFDSGSFDAVTHTDVMCCLRPKLSVLRECYRVLRPGGRLAFYTVLIPAGVTPHQYRRAMRAGGRGMASHRPYERLLDDAGFARVRAYDVTRAYLATSRAWNAQTVRHERQLRASMGSAKFEEIMAFRRATIRAGDEGILGRALFVATRP